MMFSFSNQKNKGFLLIEALIVVAVSTIVFGGLLFGFKGSLDLMAQSRTKLTAGSLAHDRMEFIRSLPYDAVGTVAGIPSGTIPQNRTVTLNEIDFNERVLIEYVDDPADGLDTATTSDSNGISADYKRVKIEYTWQMRTGTSSISVVASITPRSIETTAGGGTIRINVIDDASQFLPGASVRLRNASATIDVSRFSDASGVALISGVPAGSGYEVEVYGTIAGVAYSNDKTYQATTSNPNPVHAPFTVLESDVSTQTFQIGALSDLSMRLLSSKTEDSFIEEFSDLSGVASSSAVAVAAGSLQLENTTGYAPSGEVFLQAITPASLARWGILRVLGENTVNTEYRVSLYTGVGPYTLVPDSDLTGNAAGFVDDTINLSGLDATTYPSLVVGVRLSTGNSADTPLVHELGMYYIASETTLAGEDFTLVGNKTIGTTLLGSPIYKTEISDTTDGDGEFLFSNLEFDAYTLTPSGTYTLAEACGGYPLQHQAGVDSAWQLVYVVPVTHSLRLVVTDTAGEPIPGVEATLTRPGYASTESSSICGGAFFTGISSAELDFALTLSATGYQPQMLSDVVVDGETTITVVMSEI